MLRMFLLGLALLVALVQPGPARAETSIGADDGIGFGMLCPQPQQMVVAISVLLEVEPGYGDAIKNLGIMCSARDDAWNWSGGTVARQKSSSPDKNKPMGPWLSCPQNMFVSKVGPMRWRIAANQKVFAGLLLVCEHPGQPAVTVNPSFITDGTHAPSDFDTSEMRCLPNGNEQVSFLQGLFGRYAAGAVQGGDAAVTKIGLYCIADAPSIAPAVNAAVINQSAMLKLGAADQAKSIILQPKEKTATFDHPQINGNNVDYCLHWATQCGQPAADAYCQSQGYAKATAFARYDNEPPTFVIGDLKICNQPGCARLGQIDCTTAAATTQQTPAPPPAPAPAPQQPQAFTNPTGAKGLRLYACTTVGGNDCGQPVAVAFCKTKGFAKTTGFNTDNEKVQSETLGGQVCDKKRCKVFDLIQCAP